MDDGAPLEKGLDAASEAKLEARALRHMVRALIVSITGQPVNEAAWDKLWNECYTQAKEELGE